MRCKTVYNGLLMGLILFSTFLTGCDVSKGNTPKETETKVTKMKPELEIKTKNHESIIGAWESDIAPGYPLVLKASKKDGSIMLLWNAVIDSDIHLEGELNQASEMEYQGKIDFSAGDESSREKVILKHGASGVLSLTLDVMFEEPIRFQRGKADCSHNAEMIVTNSADFKALEGGNESLGLMEEEGEIGGNSYDFKAYATNKLGETFTLARYRVVFSELKLLKYDPIEAGYSELPGMNSVFADFPCSH